VAGRRGVFVTIYEATVLALRRQLATRGLHLTTGTTRHGVMWYAVDPEDGQVVVASSKACQVQALQEMLSILGVIDHLAAEHAAVHGGWNAETAEA